MSDVPSTDLLQILELKDEVKRLRAKVTEARDAAADALSRAVMAETRVRDLTAQRDDSIGKLNRSRDDYEDAMRALDQMEADRNRLRELLAVAADSIIEEGRRKLEAGGGPVGTIVGRFDDHKMIVAMHGEKLELGTELYAKAESVAVKVPKGWEITREEGGAIVVRGEMGGFLAKPIGRYAEWRFLNDLLAAQGRTND